MADKDKIKKTWVVLFGVAAALFLVVGLARVFADREFMEGIQYTGSAILFLVYLSLIKKGKVDISDNKKPFALGFIFSVIGPNINIGIWALGVLMLLWGLPRKK